MRFVIAPDSYKENMSALRVAQIIEQGILDVLPGARCTLAPMADGGDGTGEVLAHSLGYTPVSCTVHGPMGAPAAAEVLVREDEGTAFIETARANGLMLIPPERRDVLAASTYGVGEMIAFALERGCKKLVLSLGGSGTNDGGIGMLKALGARFYRAGGGEMAPGEVALGQVAKADLAPAAQRLAAAEVTVLSDVENPLLGPNGATTIYGPQKGAKPDMLAGLDAAMARYADAVEADIGRSVRDVPGAGAAGGLGFALYAASGARFTAGADYMIDRLGLRQKIAECDMVLTGEGRFDGQSLSGKVVDGLARAAKAAGVPLVVLAGSIKGFDFEKARAHGVSAAFSIQQDATDLPTAIRQAPENLRAAAQNVAALLALGQD